MFGLPRTHHRPKNVRLDTLVRLRWLAVFGQFAAVLVVHFGLEFDVPLWPCLAVIALAALLNVALRVSFPHTQWLEPERAAYLLGFDIAELAALLYLTGGLENPFSFLLLGPVLISATALPPRMTLLLGVFAVLCATVLIFFHYQLPWESEEQLQLPETYVVAVWLSILLAIGYIGVYTWQVAEEARQLSDALAATELVLAREQHLSQLDGLAAAAAHELGTPLATITVVVREIERALDAHSPYAEDVKLLREQAQRCREILSKITELPAGEPFDRVSILPTSAWRSWRNGRPPRCASPSVTTGRVLLRKYWIASGRPMSPIGGPGCANRAAMRTTALSALASVFSLPRLCWSVPAPHFR
jgi:two-component system sensor histidine kinase RegB